MKQVFSIFLLLAVIIGVSGCETVKGVGRDVESAGEAIQKSAE